MPHEKLEMPEVTIEEAGYVYIYFSNENETFVEVYFDDFSVTHTPTNIVQYNEYYPFGLQTVNSWSREEVMPNAFLYNGGSELNSVTNNYEMFFREYDPTLGRMNAIDPMASKYASLSPYNYAFNDPVYFNDPSGADPAYQRSDDTWWTAPRFNRGRFSGFDNARDFAFQNQGVSFGNDNPWQWTGMSMGDVYGDGIDMFGTGFISGEYFGSGRLNQEYDVYEVWIDYYTNGDPNRPIDSELSGYRFELKGRDQQQTQVDDACCGGLSEYDIPVWGSAKHASDAFADGRYLDAVAWEAWGVVEMAGIGTLYKAFASQAAKLFTKTAVSRAAVSAERLHHIFGNSKHALDVLVRKYGTQENAFNAVQNAANQALRAGQLTPYANGVLPSGNLGNIINVGGIEVRLIGGWIKDGEVVISSFSRLGL